MTQTHEIICIACPKGCHTQVMEFDGQVQVVGRICKRGKIYVQQEFKDPRRILTTTVTVRHGSARRLAVRTAAAIPKRDLMTAMATLATVCVSAPVGMGDVVYKNICAGIDVIASEDLR